MNWELLGLVLTWGTFIGSIGYIGLIEYIWRTDPTADILYHKPSYPVVPIVLSSTILTVYYFG